MLTILFDGAAYGMLLFVLACGLAVTLGLMNFVNLAHGTFAMAGGYVTTVLLNDWHVSFLMALPTAFLATATLGLVLEKTLYVRLYTSSHLDQVLFSIGIVFMSIAAVTYFMGSQQQVFQVPASLQGRLDFQLLSVGRYRALVIAMGVAILIVLQAILMKTSFGSRLRAAVDDRRVARGLGISVGPIFSLTFAIGSGLAGLGGAVGVEIVGLDPNFPLKFMINFLIVVTVGGTSGLIGPFLASLLLGMADVAGKYYLPEIGSFAIYTLLILVLLVRPQGLFSKAH
ncbi:branched-chain amino acid ABC transporter permease [Bradyrhizobium sp. CB2312]|uniref:branched-chain amino acid ABC transporter permease n=1 Tax=Bradyrhizobium sp. CB2312 TaxID=3039155 RepID=UPI0024B26569|nr:branched-chain amino acid ABC transporter permease [Bradyrhizobium sp. CB2312]WFU75450.1 branched-chain amino acid ABC transporter permease [Bradyrhizobium sp. CB2312]